jgi:hypothetical protein
MAQNLFGGGESKFKNKPTPTAPVGTELPIKFTEPVETLTDFMRAVPSGIDKKHLFIHTSIIGACTKCGVAVSVDLPVDFDFAKADRIMDGKTVKAFCDWCKQNSELRPLSPSELRNDQLYIMRRFYEIYHREKVEGRPLPPLMKEFLDAFEQKYQAMLKKEGLRPAAPPVEEPEKPRIILPE